MKYAVFFLVSVLTIICEFLYCSYMGVFKSKIKIKENSKYKSTETLPYQGVTLVLIIIICAAVSFAVQMSLYSNTSTVNYIKLYGLFVTVLAAALIDSKKKIIPNFLILFGLVFRVAVYAYEFFTLDSMKDVIKNDLIGLAIGFGVLAVVSIVTKQSVGFGDAKLFGIIGITGGSMCTYSTLFLSLVVSAVISVVLLISHKKDRKGTFPFGPCIALGYVATIFLTSF